MTRPFLSMLSAFHIWSFTVSASGGLARTVSVHYMTCFGKRQLAREFTMKLIHALMK